MNKLAIKLLISVFGAASFGFEGGPAAAASGGIGVHHAEPRIVQGVHVVHLAVVQVFEAIPAHDQAHTILLEKGVTFLWGVDFHDVLKPCAPATFDCQTEAGVFLGLLGVQKVPQMFHS